MGFKDKLKTAVRIGSALISEIADTIVVEGDKLVEQYGNGTPIPEGPAPRDTTTAGSTHIHRNSEEYGGVSLTLLDIQSMRRYELLNRQISILLENANHAVVWRSEADLPSQEKDFFVPGVKRSVVLVHRNAILSLMNMRARVGPISFDSGLIESFPTEEEEENFNRDVLILALTYSKIEQFEGFDVTTYGQSVPLQHAWYDVTGVIALCYSRHLDKERNTSRTDFIENYLHSIRDHVQVTPLISHDYNVLGPFHTAEHYLAWRSTCQQLAPFVLPASRVTQEDIFAVSYKHSVYDGTFRWSREADLQISAFIEERRREGRVTYLWFDQLLKTQTINRQDWVMAGLMPYRKYNTLRVCQVGARLVRNHQELYACECSKSMWMDIEFAVAASTGRYFMLDGACAPNVDTNLNASLEATTLPSYIEVTMCDIKGANDGLVMPAMILFSSAAHNYACRRVYSKSDVREAQEFACASLLPETMGRRGNYFVTADEMETIIYKALAVSSVTLSSTGGSNPVTVTTRIESIPPVDGASITPFSFLPGLVVQIHDTHGFPKRVHSFGTSDNPGQYWGLHCGRANKLAYANLICDGDRERVICRVVAIANKGVHIQSRTRTLTSEGTGIGRSIDFDYAKMRETSTW